MKHLIILAHPKKESFCAAICEALHSALEATGDEVKVRDLYESDFDPVDMRWETMEWLEPNFIKTGHHLSESMSLSNLRYFENLTFLVRKTDKF